MRGRELAYRRRAVNLSYCLLWVFKPLELCPFNLRANEECYLKLDMTRHVAWNFQALLK